MAIELKEINPFIKKELKQFIQFPFDLYKNDPYWVPSLWIDEYDLFSPVHNPVLKHCELKLFLAFDHGIVKGRIAGIINRRENQLYGKSKARFGWYDVVDDIQVTKLLLSSIESWAQSFSMNEIEGPMSFTNLDKAGLLIEVKKGPCIINKCRAVYLTTNPILFPLQSTPKLPI